MGEKKLCERCKKEIKGWSIVKETLCGDLLLFHPSCNTHPDLTKAGSTAI